MEKLLIPICIVIALLALAEGADKVIDRIVMRWAARRIEKRLTRVEPPEVSEEWHDEPLDGDDCECMGEYPMKVYFKPAWIELVLRDIQRADKAKWN